MTSQEPLHPSLLAFQASSTPLSKSWKNRHRFMIFKQVAFVLCGIISVALTIIMALISQRPSIITSSIFISIFITVSVGIEMWLEGRLERTLPNNSVHFIESLLRDNAARRLMWRLNVVGLCLILGFLSAWIPWRLIEDEQLYLAEPWRMIIGVGGIIVILIGVILQLWKAHRRLVHEAEQIEVLRQTLNA